MTVMGQIFSLPDDEAQPSASQDGTVILSYLPIVSILSLDFKRFANQVRIELQRCQQLPSEVFSPPKISTDILSLPLSELDFERSYIAINWSYLFNLRERMRDFTAPNLLIYYRLPSLKVIGLQLDSLRMLRQWSTCDDSTRMMSQNLREFIDMERESQSQQMIQQDGNLEGVYHQDFHGFIGRFFDIKD